MLATTLRFGIVAGLRPADTEHAHVTLDQIREKTWQLSETICGVRATRAGADRFSVDVKCPRCHRSEAIEAMTRFGCSSYFCPACEHGWDVRRSSSHS